MCELMKDDGLLSEFLLIREILLVYSEYIIYV